MRAFGAKLRQAIGTATAGRAAGLPDWGPVSHRTPELLGDRTPGGGLCGAGFIALAPALAVMLGADIGSTLVVQALSFKIAMLVPLLLILGVGRRDGDEDEPLAADRPHRDSSASP